MILMFAFLAFQRKYTVNTSCSTHELFTTSFFVLLPICAFQLSWLGKGCGHYRKQGRYRRVSSVSLLTTPLLRKASKTNTTPHARYDNIR